MGQMQDRAQNKEKADPFFVLAAIPASDHMIKRPGLFQAQLAWHPATLPTSSAVLNGKV
jgi:hypothetical protein